MYANTKGPVGKDYITFHMYVDFYETTYVRSYICMHITTLSLGVNFIIKYARTYSNSRDGHEKMATKFYMPQTHL